MILPAASLSPIGASLTAKMLEALLPRLDHHKEREFPEKAQAGMKEWNELMQEGGTRKDKPTKPEVVAYELNKRLS